MVLHVFQVFLQVFQVHISSVSSTFRRMLQVLYLDVLKVDQMLYFPPRLLLPRFGISSFRRRLGIRRHLPLFSMLVTFKGSAGNGLQTQASRLWLKNIEQS
jgi:hypothetical protein